MVANFAEPDEVTTDKPNPLSADTLDRDVFLPLPYDDPDLIIDEDTVTLRYDNSCRDSTFYTLRFFEDENPSGIELQMFNRLSDICLASFLKTVNRNACPMSLSMPGRKDIGI